MYAQYFHFRLRLCLSLLLAWFGSSSILKFEFLCVNLEEVNGLLRVLTGQVMESICGDIVSLALFYERVVFEQDIPSRTGRDVPPAGGGRAWLLSLIYPRTSSLIRELAKLLRLARLLLLA